MKNSIVGKVITIITIISLTVEVGIGIGYYMLANMDFNKFNTNYKVEVVNK